MRALVLGGGPEGRDITKALLGNGWYVTTSIAKESSMAFVPRGEVHVGGFGGPAGLTQWLLSQAVELVVDASDPFAERISLSAAEATRALGIPFVVLRQPEWQPERTDKWTEVSSLKEASTHARRFHHILVDAANHGVDAFATDHDNLYVFRSSAPLTCALPARSRRLPAPTNASVHDERQVLRDNQIDCLVVRETLGDVPAIMRAARELGIPAIVVKAPAGISSPLQAHTIPELISILDKL